MKLKKIAALALAGVMAISMLAGCKGNATTDDSASSTPTTSATGYSAKLGEILKGLGNEKVTYSDSTATTSLLTSALAEVELKGLDLSKASTSEAKPTSDSSFNSTTVADFGDKVEELAGYSVVGYVDTLTTIDGTETEGSKTTTVDVYVVNGNFTESKALDLIAAQVDTATKNLKTQMLGNAAGQKQNVVNVKYTGSISMQKVSADGASAWVAVVSTTADVTVTKNVDSTVGA